MRSLICVLRLSVVVAFGLIALGSDASGQGKKKKNIESQVFKNLVQHFNKWDKNNDNQLDKSELAHAFRGNNAKPWDKTFTPLVAVIPPTPPPKLPTLPEPKSSGYRNMPIALAVLPRPSLPASLAVAQLLWDYNPRPSKEPPAPVVTTPPPSPTIVTQSDPRILTLPDFQFMQSIGKGDSVSKKEFDAWAHKIAKLVDDIDDHEDEIKQSQKKVQSAKNAKAKQQAQQELVRHQQQLQAVMAQFNTIPPAIRKALGLKAP